MDDLLNYTNVYENSKKPTEKKINKVLPPLPPPEIYPPITSKQYEPTINNNIVNPITTNVLENQSKTIVSNLKSTIDNPNVIIAQTAFNPQTIYFGSGSSPISINGSNPISVTGTNPYTVSLEDSGVVAGNYTLAEITVDSKGLITDIQNGIIPPNDDWSNFEAQTDVNMDSHKIINLAPATVGTDATNKTYVDGAIVTAISAIPLGNYLQKSGGTMTGAIDMGTNKISNIGVATDPNDAITKGYVDTKFLEKTGGVMTGTIDMGTNKISNLGTPTLATDATTKTYVDNAISGGLGGYLPLTGGTMASDSATINMNGADITNTGSLYAGGISETVEFGSAIAPMFANRMYATNVSINSYNPLSAMNFIGVGGVNINAPDEDINLNAGDINLTQTDVTSFMNLTATGAIVLGAGLGVDITAGTTVQINSAGNISIGSGNVLGADTEIEKIGFKDNEIYKITGGADITIEDVASIKNVGAGSLGTMLLESESDLTINSTAGKVNIESISVNGSNITSTGLVDISAPDISLLATTGTIVLNSQLANVEVENLTFTLTGSPATGTTISTANSGRDINISTQTTGDFNVSTGGNPRIQIDGAVNGNNTLTNSGTGFTQINSALGGGSGAPILKLQNTNTTAGSGSVYIESYKAKNVATGDNLFVIGQYGNRTNGTKLEMARIETTINDATLNSEDVRMSFYVRDDGVFGGTPQFEIHGNEGQINMRLPLDMNGQNITSSGTAFNLQNISSIALGNTTNVGQLGYNITSRAGAGGALWLQPRQSIIANYGGGSTIDDTTPVNFGASLPTISFSPSVNGRYKVSVSIGFELQSSADLLIYPEVVYNGGTYAGAVYAPPLYVVAPHVNKAGVIHNSASFIDYFTVPISGTSIPFTVDVKVLTVSGSTSTNNVKTFISVEPDFN